MTTDIHYKYIYTATVNETDGEGIMRWVDEFRGVREVVVGRLTI